MMKIQKYHILFLVFSLLSVLALRANPVSVTFIEVPHLQEGPDNEETGHGHRIPPRPIMCTIDFSAEDINFSQDVQDIESYEVWDESQSLCLYMADNEADFVQYLSVVNEPVTIILRSLDFLLISTVPVKNM